MSISNKALIVNLRISQWTGRKLDRKATSSVEQNFTTDGKVGNYTKKLLPNCRELDAVSRQVSVMRNFFYEQTLPWYSDGSRIISSKAYLDFVNEFSKLRGKYEQAVAAFLSNYPRLRSNAAASLGALFNAADYPEVEYLSKAFACEIAFFPVPDVSDFRTEVLDSEKEVFLKAIRETEAAATRECWTRLHKVISKATERLGQPEAIFRDSLIENITDLCALLPKLNVMEDSSLETMRQEVERAVRSTSAAQCRASESARKKTADSLNDIMSRMSGLVGDL